MAGCVHSPARRAAVALRLGQHRLHCVCVCATRPPECAPDAAPQSLAHLNGVVPYISSYSKMPKLHQSTGDEWPAALMTCGEGDREQQQQQQSSQWLPSCSSTASTRTAAGSSSSAATAATPAPARPALLQTQPSPATPRRDSQPTWRCLTSGAKYSSVPTKLLARATGSASSSSSSPLGAWPGVGPGSCSQPRPGT